MRLSIASVLVLWFGLIHLASGQEILAAMGEIDEAHNLLHLSIQDDAIPSANRKTLAEIDVQMHQLLVMVSGKIKRGNDRYDSKDLEAAINEYRAVLEVWPKCAAASYELARSLSDTRACLSRMLLESAG